MDHHKITALFSNLKESGAVPTAKPKSKHDQDEIARLRQREKPKVKVTSKGVLWVDPAEAFYSKMGRRAVESIKNLNIVKSRPKKS